ncbi:GerAB/ArcD/ProY family transporter [Clostridium paridis]|uniref:GerAB/ArcD/ProY family transporter n=1 Tax=Clostridium paridis TaxID=2803863 RepID=A0A937FDL9_9CLOT|nr:GerAB/ArcD/ProY family transporter [Clostridium paridis]MBL4930362.1 GerAB/ArcD/ProY family transporter [Clostridium paridis]
MFKNSDSKIGTKETITLITILLFTNTFDNTPSFIFKDAKNAGWLVPIISAVIILIPILCTLNLLKKFKDKGLIEIIYMLTGKYFGFILILLLIVLNIFFLIGNIRDNCSTISTLFFPKTSTEILVFTLIGASCYVASLGLKASARTAFLFLFYFVINLLLILIFSKHLIIPAFLFPLAGGGIKSIFKASLLNVPIFQVIILLSICFPMFKNHKCFKKSSLFSLLISCILIAVIFIIIQMTFDYPATSIIALPFFTFVRLINITRFLSNLEALLFLPSVIILVLYYSVYLYLVTAMFTNLLKLKKVEPFILPVTALIAILCLIPENSIKISLLIHMYLLPILSTFIIILPITLSIIAQWKGAYNK